MLKAGLLCATHPRSSALATLWPRHVLAFSVDAIVWAKGGRITKNILANPYTARRAGPASDHLLGAKENCVRADSTGLGSGMWDNAASGKTARCTAQQLCSCAAAMAENVSARRVPVARIELETKLQKSQWAVGSGQRPAWSSGGAAGQSG